MNGAKFLIVDDLEGNRKLMSRLISLHFPNAILHTASSGSEAMDQLARTDFDIVVLDAVMPHPNGLEVCRRIKNDPHLRSTLVLMVSAQLTDTESRINGLESGADGYLCKPFDNPELIAQIRAMMRIRDTENELHRQQEALKKELVIRKETEEKLREANRAAEEAVRAKSEFLAHMSHEIRTPMNAVIGMTEILLGTTLNADQQDYVQTIHTAGDTLLSVINDILDFSKIESGKLSLEQRVFSPDALIREAVRMVRSPAESKNLRLNIELGPAMPRAVVGDKIRLRQILLNLLSNAVKFTQKGTITVATSACRMDGHQCGLHIEVRDTGIGIPEDKRDRLFQSFSQVDDSTTRRFGGTGLGLAISQRLANLMDGSIRVESEPGKGSTFHVCLCLPIPAESLTPPPQALMQEEPSTLTGRRALIVDDNETNRRILAHQLRSWGMGFEEADRAETALARLQSPDPFDVALVDMEMPGMDGVGFARQVRDLKGREKLPLILISSVDSDRVDRAIREKAIGSESLFLGRLSKPVDSSTLYDTLVNVLPRPRAGEDQPASAATSPTPQALRVLVAEDNPVNRKVADLMLRRLGCTTVFATDGNEAVQAVQAAPFDVILMDIQMPNLDGVEAMKKIRAILPPGRCPPIVALTAHAMQGDRDKYIELGMDHYLGKPIREADLQQLLSQIANPRRNAL